MVIIYKLPALDKRDQSATHFVGADLLIFAHWAGVNVINLWLWFALLWFLRGSASSLPISGRCVLLYLMYAYAFCPFFYWVLCLFLNWFIGVLYIFSILALCWSYVFQISLPCLFTLMTFFDKKKFVLRSPMLRPFVSWWAHFCVLFSKYFHTQRWKDMFFF